MTSVLATHSGPTRTVWFPMGARTWTVPPATGNISNVTSVPAIFSVYATAAADCPGAVDANVAADVTHATRAMRVANATTGRGVRTGIAGLLFACVVAAGCARDVPLERFEFRERQMGTEARIVLYARSRDVADTAAKAAFARIAQLDETLSDYRKESELLRVLMRGENIPARVSDDLFAVLRASLALSEETNGAFDVTVGVLTSRARNPRWTRNPHTGVVTELPRRAVPASAPLCAGLQRIGWKNVELDTIARTVLFKRSDMRLDLGGIGKGYALDAALAVLRNHGVERALVSMGGDLVVGRAPPGSAGWDITVDDADSAHRAVTLENAALSTSGDTEQFRDSAGVRLSHVIDPRTGAPLSSRLKATVRASTGTQADGWSTAVTVMDSAARGRFIAAHPEADFYIRTSSTGPPPASGERGAGSWCVTTGLFVKP